VLNNRKDVSPEAKRRILEIVEEHNFVPNNNAKHLKQTISKSVRVLVKGTSNMLFASILEVIQQVVEASEYTVGVTYLEEDANEVEEAIRLCRDRKPMGILFLGGNPSFFKEKFAEVNVPCVLVTNRGEELGFDNLASVATDDVKAAEEAVDYLISMGHHDIAVLGGDLSSSHTSMQRYLGYMQSCRKHGYELDAAKYYEKARFTFDSAYQAMSRILDKGIPLTAVFAMSDVMAIGAIRAIRDRGLLVPEDISMIGFDGITLADYYNPKIVTIRQGYEQIASRSVELLFRMIDLNAPAIHELVPFELQNTESVKRING
jgi:LacI family transcriptional regulator